MNVMDDTNIIMIKEEVREEGKEQEADTDSDGFTGEGWMQERKEEDDEQMEERYCDRFRSTSEGWMSDDEDLKAAEASQSDIKQGETTRTLIPHQTTVSCEVQTVQSDISEQESQRRTLHSLPCADMQIESTVRKEVEKRTFDVVNRIRHFVGGTSNSVIQVEIKQEAEDDGSLHAQTLVGENILSVREIDSEEEDSDDEFAHFPTKFYIKQEPSDDDEEDIVPSGLEGMIIQARDSSTLTTSFMDPEQPSTSKGDIADGEEDSIEHGMSINSDNESHLIVHSGGKLHQCCCCHCKKKLCQGPFTHVRSCTQRNECCYCKQEYSCKCDQEAHTKYEYLRIQEGCSHKLNQTDHLQTVVRKKPFQCSHCMMAFSQRSTLTSHLRTHTGEKPFECSYCNKGFSQKGILTSHLRTHTGEKPYECSQCQKKFSGKKLLTHHLRRHTGEKPYECSYCGKRFVEKSGMNRHLKTHTGEKPYKCPQCKKGFIQKGHLNYHLRTHTDKKSYECSHCKDTFFHKKDLNSHLKLHKGKKNI